MYKEHPGSKSEPAETLEERAIQLMNEQLEKFDLSLYDFTTGWDPKIKTKTKKIDLLFHLAFVRRARFLAVEAGIRAKQNKLLPKISK